jgi:tRNA(Arg) A34 adenosine deaminase TadA
MGLTLSKMTDAELMERAVAQARLSLDEGVMPIGAVLACNGDVLAEAHWKGFQQGLLSHPEHEVLIDADRSIASRSRRESTLYTTLEPCLMCMGTATSFLLASSTHCQLRQTLQAPWSTSGSRLSVTRRRRTVLAPRD